VVGSLKNEISARVALVAAAVAVIIAAGVPALGQVPGEPTRTDDGEDLWVRAAGAGFGELQSQVTPIELDFFDVSFWNQQQGLAGGARCREALPAQPGENEADYGTRLDACERVPEIWRYREDRVGSGSWQRAELEGADRTGYVGALVWIGNDRALAVGGDGRYPRREPNAREDDHDSRVLSDPAGNARAWLYDIDQFGDEGWHELHDLPAGMRGLTALDIRRDVEWGWAGGLGQLWNWDRGRFDPEPVDNETDSEKRNPNLGIVCSEGTEVGPPPRLTALCVQQRRVRNAWLFEFRVREIKTPTRSGPREVFAVTAGCCAEDPGRNTPRTIRYSGSDGKWTVTEHLPCGDIAPPETEESLGAQNPCRGIPSPVATRTDPNSFYSVTPRFTGGNWDVRPIAAEGGPERPDEPDAVKTWDGDAVPGSRVVAGDGDTEPVAPGSGDRGNATPDWQVGELRTDQGLGAQGLVYTSFPKPADPRPKQVPLTGCAPPVVNDGLGVYPGLHGVPAWRDTVGTSDVKDGDNDPTGGSALGPALKSGNAVLYPGCYGRAVEQNGTGQADTGQRPPWDPPGPAWAADSYALNAIDMIGAQALGWAAGDRGALLRLGGPSRSAAQLSGDPSPPELGSGELEVADSSPYDGLRRPSATGEPGTVPALAARPAVRGAGLIPVSFGSPDPRRPASLPGEAVTNVVMSRDGGEGWAVGPLGNGAPTTGREKLQTTLYHFDGRKWYRCDTRGLAGLMEPDPACASVRELIEFVDPKSTSSEPSRVKIYAAARVPLEHDSNTANDDDFEVVALATREAGMASDDCPMLRYRHGRWQKEPLGATRGLVNASGRCPGDAIWDLGKYALEFAAPDDGWLVSNDNTRPHVHHYDGTRWVPCVTGGLGTGSGLSNSRECGNQGADGSVLPAEAGGSRIDTVRGLARAGRRVYMYGSREVRGGGSISGVSGQKLPFILYRDPGDCVDAENGTAGCWRSRAGGLDPFAAADPLLKPGDTVPPAGNANVDQLRGPVYPPAEVEGSVTSLSVVVDGEDEDGDPVYRGWAGGSFKRTAIGGGDPDPGRIDAGMLRLEGGAWSEWRTRDAAYDNFAGRVIVAGAALNPQSLLTLPELGPGGVEAVAAMSPGVRLLGFYPERRRWEALRPNPATGPLDNTIGDRKATAVAADGAGGFWLATGMAGPGTSFLGGTDTRRTTWFHRFAAEVPEPVFGAVPSPIATGRVTALAGGADGTVLVASDDAFVYRYDRLMGWERVAVPGWDPGRIVTRRSSVNAVAVGPDGEGLAVGEEGRIARVGSARAALDPAAGRLCDAQAPRGPCGTSRDLEAVSIAPDGSAMVGGRARTLLWRPAAGEFRTIARPPVSPSATITGVSLPAPERAWITTDGGLLYAGMLDGTDWSWELEGSTADGDLLTLDESLAPENALALRAVAVDAGGNGYAVGDRGLVLERGGDADEPWRRLKTGFLDDLTAITLGAGGGEGALVGGKNGLILTLQAERFEIARGADPFRPIREQVRGLALVPGHEEGELEAWAAIAEADPGDIGYVRKRAGANELLHYSSRPEDPLLDGQAAAKPLPDSPAKRAGELTFAAFGKSDCPIDPLNGIQCPSYAGSNRPVDRILDGIAAELGQRSDLDFAVHTGDAYENGADAESSVTGYPQSLGATRVPVRGAPFESAAVRYRRFSEGILEPLRRAGTPVFGAIGGADVTDEMACDGATTGLCVPVSGRQYAKVGINLGWRQGFGGEPAPWGRGGGPTGSELEFTSVPGSGTTAGAEDIDAAAGGREVGGVTGSAQARTHYALDVTGAGRKVARLVVADNSLRSLAGSDPVQNPVEGDGGQLTWLERMICIQGSATDTGGCSREAGQQAVVVLNTPTYSYGPGGIGDTATDSAQVETVLRRHRVSMVVSGRLGWNGRYWATAPGVHEPCPGGAYQERPPEPGTRVCGQGAEGDAQGQAEEQLAAALDGLGAPAAPAVDAPGAAAGVLPAVVAASAGGGFGPDGRAEGTAAEGFWRGYSVVRLDPDGDPGGAIVEQRPVLDWIIVTAQQHVLRPGQRLTLRGMGREPIGIEQSQNVSSDMRAPRYIRIDSPAITHRYDLLLADPEQPWLPATDANGDYIPLPSEVATVDPQAGTVRARKGARERTYAIGLLSVGDKAATYPLVFEPRRSFTPTRARVALPPLPRAARAPAPQQPLRVADPPPPPSPPPATPSSPLVSQTLQAPGPPQLPSLPSLSPAAPPPPPQLQAPPPPPVPPAPPNVPPPQQPLPLALGTKLQAVAIVPSVNPPAPPPVNPAPPGGAAARKEAKQRQAATAKSEEGASNEATEAGGDFTEGSKNSESGVQATRRTTDRPMPATRRTPDRAAASFSPLANREQPSAWARGALYGGGLGLGALAFTAAWLTLRPRARRREPRLPAPAHARVRR
jgi:hypothetical protein